MRMRNISFSRRELQIRSRRKDRPADRATRGFLLSLVMLSWILFLQASGASAQTGMKGPSEGSRQRRTAISARCEETSSIKLAFLGLLAAYQHVVSPVGSGRCAFSPSCSTFSTEALRERGVVVGIMMTADRLMRDHPGVLGEGHYTLLPNGRLFDPVSYNAGVLK